MKRFTGEVRRLLIVQVGEMKHNIDGCPDIASVRLLRATYPYNETHLNKGLWLKPRGCRSTVSLPASFRAVYPATVCFYSICELALSLRQHKLAKTRPGRWRISAHRQGAQTVLKARLAKSSLRQQKNPMGANSKQMLEIGPGEVFILRDRWMPYG